MNTNDPTQFPGNQSNNMGVTDMSGLLGGQDSQQEQAPEEDGVNSEMYKKVIEALMEKVQSKYGELNAAKFSGDNQNDAQRNDILKTIFESMKQAGVDPSDPGAINEFMTELEQINPDLFELFNESLDHLLGPDTNQSSQPGFNTIETTPVTGEQPQPQSPEDPTQSSPPIQEQNLSLGA